MPKIYSPSSPIIKNQLETWLVLLKLLFVYWFQAIGTYKSFLKARESLKKIQIMKKNYFGRMNLKKVAKVDGKYYWLVGGPSLFSPALKTFILVGLNKMVPFQEHDHGLQVVFLAITRKCPLRCEHCFEGKNLSAHESLSTAELIGVVEYFQNRGVAQIQFTGGEPMSRYDDMLKILRSGKSGTDFWVNTSGFQLDLQKAMELKMAGLTGVIVSLDHFEEEEHNRFRKDKHAYNWALSAVQAVVQADMPVTLSICTTREFISMENLMTYAELGKKLGVTFIQLLEPKAVGNYEGKDVLLNEEHKKILYEFYMKLTFESQYQEWPIVNYHGYHKDSAGCLGAGDRFLYINSIGQINPCPFCDKSFGNILEITNTENIERMKNVGCTME